MTDNLLAELRDIRKHGNDTVELLEKLYYKTQVYESDKVPDEWSAQFVNLTTKNITQIVPASSNRKEITIGNTGPASVFLLQKSTVDEGLMDNYNSSGNSFIPGILLTAGTSVSIKSSGSVWAYPLDTTGAGINIIESLFSGLPDTAKYAKDYVEGDSQIQTIYTNGHAGLQ